jgi:hypothetical protein
MTIAIYAMALGRRRRSKENWSRGTGAMMVDAYRGIGWCWRGNELVG